MTEFWASEYTKLALKMTPMPHQQRVSDRLNDTDNLLVYHGLGSGKTFTAINAADQHGLPLLAIVPAALRNNMRKEIAASGFKGKATVISYEEAQQLKDDPAFRAMASNSLVTFDEAHRMGRMDSARSSLAGDIPGKKKLFLTGTPMRNHPAEMGPILNAIGNKQVIPSDPTAFNKKFVTDEKTSPGFWGTLRGVKPGNTQVASNMQDFNKAIAGHVDYNPSGTEHFPTSDEQIINVPMSHMQKATYNAVMGKYPEMAYKIMHGIPPSKTEMSRFQAFSTGPRMIANHPGEFNLSATDEDAPKMLMATDEIKKRIIKDPNYRGVTYSAYLGSGVNPMSRLLTQAGVAHAVFDGTKDDEERKQIIGDYNSGKIKHLLVSGAGSEGLDLKGTKLLQIMEPHWNESRIEQMKGRAIRYKSHDHLPANERHVEVQRFHSVNRSQKMFGGTEDTPTIDGYLYDMSKKKDALNQQFLGALQGKEGEFWATEYAEKEAGLSAFFNPAAAFVSAAARETPTALRNVVSGNFNAARKPFQTGVRAATIATGRPQQQLNNFKQWHAQHLDAANEATRKLQGGVNALRNPSIAPAARSHIIRNVEQHRNDISAAQGGADYYARNIGWHKDKFPELHKAGEFWATEHAKLAMPFAQNQAGAIEYLQHVGHGLPVPAPQPVTNRNLASFRNLEREAQRYNFATWPHANPSPGFKLVHPRDVANLKIPPTI